MSVRKRDWTSPKGEQKSAWVCSYTDQNGKRRLKTFARKKEADAFEASAKVEVRAGVHTADSASVTVAKAAELWLASCSHLERTTVAAYQQHVDLHIVPYLGRVKLSQLTGPAVREFEDKLRTGAPAPGKSEGKVRSPAMVKRVVASLGFMISDAMERGLTGKNPVREIRSNRKRGKERQSELRARGKLVVGKDIPTPAEIKAIINALEGKWRPMLLTATLTGLRASELRGLRWQDVDLSKRELHVRQRADRFQAIGQPKTAAGARTVPLPPLLVSTLREWKVACPPSSMGLVFPTGTGQIEYHSNIVHRGLKPVQVAAGVTVPKLDADGRPELQPDGRPLLEAKYTGLHALRHFYASWCINRRADGGLELPAKVVQQRLGHSNIGVTLDTYSHLFPSGDDGSEMAAAERSLLA